MDNNYKTYNDEYDSFASKSLALAYLAQSTNIILKITFSRNNFIQSNISLLFFVLIAVFFLYNIKKSIKKVLIPLLFSEVIFISLMLFSLLMNPGIDNYLFSKTIWTFGLGIPISVLVYKMNDVSRINEFLLRASIFVSLASIAAIINISTVYSMSLSYMLLIALIVIYNNTNRYKMLWVIVIYLFLVILVLGSRGPIMLFMIYVLTKKLILDKKNIMHYFLSISLGTLMLIFVISEKWKIAVYNIMNYVGFDSRTLRLLMNSQIFYDSGRIHIFKYFGDRILEKPFWGWGICSEILLIDSAPHNLLLELLFDYGILGGGVFIIFLLVISLLAFRIKVVRKEVFMFFCIGILPLMISNSYTTWIYFWIYIAISLNVIKKANYYKKMRMN